MATSFHGFLVKEKIGSGGMSTVYKGFHETLGYPVAIKVLHPGMAGDKSFIARFEREAKAASALRNNNIASVIDFGSEDDIYFIVMEFVEGQDLGQILSDIQNAGNGQKVFPIEIVFSILEEVAYGLKDAHEQGIIHRDIKPSNILLHKRGEVKIADFGLARDTRDVNPLSDFDLTIPGTVVGTPSFMSPEQAAGRELDHRTDIFSLGVMAYQLLMGEKPFRGSTAAEVQEAIITKDPPALSRERCPLLIPEVEALVTKMLAKDPNRRFQNMEQLLRSLSECMEKVDSSRSLIKFKRDYLTKFSQDPIGFSLELKKKSVHNHLKQGLHYQKMGLSNIDDAIREFNYVLSLDPDNEKAKVAIAELIKNAEESGIVPAYQPSPAFDSGETQVLATSDLESYKAASSPPPAEPKKQKPADWKKFLAGIEPRILYGGGAALLLILILALVFLPGGDETLPESGTEVAVIDEPVVEEQEETPVTTPEPEIVDLNEDVPPELVGESPLDGAGTDAQDGPEGTTVDSEPEEEKPVIDPKLVSEPEEEEPEPTLPMGSLIITSNPGVASVYLREHNKGGSFRLAGTTPHATGDLAVGNWEIRLEKDGFVGVSKVYGVQEGTERSLSVTLESVVAPSTDPGFFRVVVVPFGNVYLDGELVVEGKKVAVVPASPRVKHQLRINHGPTRGDFVLNDLKVDSGETLDLGRRIFSAGSLKVASNYPAEVLFDGTEINETLPLDWSRVLVGDHVLTIRKAGHVVDKAWLFGDQGKVELQPVKPGAPDSGYLITIEKNETLRIKFDLKSAN